MAKWAYQACKVWEDAKLLGWSSKTKLFQVGIKWNETTCFSPFKNPSENHPVSFVYVHTHQQQSLLRSCISTYIPPSRKLQTFSSLLETRWKVSLMICCSVSSFCTEKQNREMLTKIKRKMASSVAVTSHFIERKGEGRILTLFTQQ